MIISKPFLFVNRLVLVTHTGAIAYDEKFHSGVNIIRGKNSSGKSTISNFIFFALGGDFNNWTKQALFCSDVYAELNINGATITVKRVISENNQQPLSLYWGDYEKAKTDNLNWKTFPYKQTENKISFTRAIFNALNFPEIKTETDSNITMHQILRLIYVDQDSPAQSLFRFERFDIPLTRLTVAEVLLGYYDDSLYNDRMSLRENLKTHEEKKKQFEAISKVYGHAGNETSIISVNKEIEKSKGDIIKIDSLVQTLKAQARVRTSVNTQLETERIQDQLIPARKEVEVLKNQIEDIDYDIFDSSQFIEMLEKRIYELENAIVTKKIFSELELSHCPQCHSLLDNIHTEANCSLCKQVLSKESEATYASRMRQELALQAKESKSLLVNKKRKAEELKVKLDERTQIARGLQKQLDIAIAETQSTRDDRIDQMLVEKGGVVKKLEFLAQQLKNVALLESLRKELSDLSMSIDTLRLDISNKMQKQQQNYNSVVNKIQSYTLEILKRDLDRQEEFKTSRKVDIDFARDTFSLDGNNSFSASSNIYFKNAIHFAIFFASLDLGFMRYPKFILCDNMEDKGMEKERTQNFQNVIAEISARIETTHQIIFTTSMVSDELNNTSLCVGFEYHQGNKTLKV
ncbi:AAA family ATPase [Pedobacter sp. UYP1]|uniref:AAA family ATPase n=1 Tax=Pedobacter sp. UYP1 TaxID=1756396 RepID=UPI00339B21B2